MNRAARRKAGGFFLGSVSPLVLCQYLIFDVAEPAKLQILPRRVEFLQIRLPQNPILTRYYGSGQPRAVAFFSGADRYAAGMREHRWDLQMFRPTYPVCIRRSAVGGALLLAWSLTVLGCGDQTAAPRTQTSPAQYVVLDVVADGEFQKRHHDQCVWSEGMTVIDVLQQAMDRQRLEIEHRGSGQTAFVERINGVENVAGGRNWLFRVNGQRSSQGAGSVTVRPNDVILWEYVAGGYNDASPPSDQEAARRDPN